MDCGNSTMQKIIRAPFLDLKKKPTIAIAGMTSGCRPTFRWRGMMCRSMPMSNTLGKAMRKSNREKFQLHSILTASYVKYFEVPERMKGQRIFISFQGAESGLALWLNGSFVGYSEDSFTPSEFELTPYLKDGRKQTGCPGIRQSGPAAAGARIRISTVFPEFTGMCTCIPSQRFIFLM